MDHRELLLKFIANTIDVQGVSLIDAVGPNIRFSDKEQIELRKLEQQARAMLRR
jgi:hypothetical protein